MTTLLAAALAVLLAYLIGATPFGLLIARWARGIDIRTVGSGNIGATNVGRMLGFRFFLLVFALDALKGYGPTAGFPRAVAGLTGRPVPNLAAVVALAAILGHNFSVYLKFRGGKGVATSLGALAALDPVACVGALLGFLVTLLVTSYVSIASVCGGLAFAIVHFALTPNPWGRQQWAMSGLTLVLLALVVVRHRINFVRIFQGTEAKVSLLRRRGQARSGRIAVWALFGLVLLGVGCGVWAWSRMRARPVLHWPGGSLTVVGRTLTGHQRTERLAYFGGGRRLAVTCPRYDRLVLYRVGPDGGLAPFRDLPLDGRPVAVAGGPTGVIVLERPSSDARHVAAGWWEAFGPDGRRIGSRVPIGFDPDDVVLAPDRRTALVLLSGSAEGEANRPDPELLVVDLAAGLARPRILGRVTIAGPDGDPQRVALDPETGRAVVTVRGTRELVWVDWAERHRPRIGRREPFPAGGEPGALSFGPDGTLAVLDGNRPAVWIREKGGGPLRSRPLRGIARDIVALGEPGGPWACSLERQSALEVLEPATGRSWGCLPLRGAANLAPIRPYGLAVLPRPGRLAVANASGGSVHALGFRTTAGAAPVETPVLARARPR